MARARHGTVVKIGGSLVADGARLRGLLARLAEGAEGPALIVPGGGPFADAVRTAQDALGFEDALAHRLALDAMGRMAEVFCALEPRLSPTRDPVAISDRVAVWDPALLRAGLPEIPENWDVTSDSLALWLGEGLRAARCLLVKSAPCPVGAEPEALARDGLVDRAFPAFAKAFGGAIEWHGPGTVAGPRPVFAA